MAVNDLAPQPRQARQVRTTSLVDLLDRVIGRGAAVSGDIIIALAGIDLIRLDLRLLLAPVDRADREPGDRR
jgi:hypothetical protein